MTFSKYPKHLKKAKKVIKKRFTTRTGGVRVNQIARDVYNIQRMLNVEHKHLDYQFGSGKAVGAQRPTKTTPIILALPAPVRGTAFDNRVGNQIRVVHMTTKFEFLFENNSDLMQRATVKAQILFAKSGDDVPTIDKLYDLDANGHYTPMSFSNTQEFSKYQWIKQLTHQKGYTQPTNRYPLSNGTALTKTPQDAGSGNITVSSDLGTALNNATFYSNKQSKVSIKMMFQNGSDTIIEQMKPYLLLRSDVIEHATAGDYDPVVVSGQIRLTYVDN